MASIMIDRQAGLASGSAWKGPCRVATTANITLAGLQTIDDVVLVADDRVLVKNQSVPSQNGIYIADTGTWARARDFSRTKDVRTGTQVFVTAGTVNNDVVYRLTTANPVAIGTDDIVFEAQASDATLVSIGALGTAADKIIYTTGVDTWAETPITAFGRSLIDDANAAAALTTLGAVIGTNVQAYDAGLTSIAGLTTAADKLPYTTASDTYAVTTLTSFGRSLIDDADAATARATLGLVIDVDVPSYGSTITSAPVGTVAAFATMAAPSGWLVCDGSAVSRATYAGLYDAIAAEYLVNTVNGNVQLAITPSVDLFIPGAAGTVDIEGTGIPVGATVTAAGTGVINISAAATATATGITARLFPFGNGDGSTTFNIPDLRGIFVRGSSYGGAVDSDRQFGSTQADELKAHTHDIGGTLATNTDNTGGSNRISDLTNTGTGSDTGITASTGGTETRPRNIALLYCIKT